MALFGALAYPWLKEARYAMPSGGVGHPADDYLLAWVLAWVADALRTAPAAVFDAPINYPAPLQLTGTEHLFAFQLAFAPLYWLLDNAILATNIVVFLTFPLAAFAMQRLLLAMELSAGVSWVGGLLFALGPLCVPVAFHKLQYTNLFLPWTALALVRLRRSPRPGGAVALFLALVLGCLSSYYTAVLVGLSGAIFGIIELLRGGPGRGRYCTLAVGASAVAAIVVVVVSWPYLSRPEATRESWAAQLAAQHVQFAISRSHATAEPIFFSGLAALGVLGFVARQPGVRICACMGLILVLTAQAFMAGVTTTFGGIEFTLPYGWLVQSPLQFFRYPFRFVVLMGFGTAMLSVAALEALRSFLGRIAGTAIVAAVAIAIIATHGVALPGGPPADVPAQHLGIYDLVAQVAARQGTGPLLELPDGKPLGPHWLGAGAESMLGATRHRLPLLLGHTGYAPQSRAVVDSMVSRLPATEVLDLLVGATRLRWVLLRPPSAWRQPEKRKAWWGVPGVEHVAAADGYDLFRIDRQAKGRWYSAIRRGPVEGATILGTPLRPLSAEAAIGIVSGVELTEVAAGAWSLVGASVLNAGDETWPAGWSKLDKRFRVQLVWSWRRLPRSSTEEANDDLALERTCDLPWDLPPRRRVGLGCYVQAPSEPGLYELTIAPRQVDGAFFSGGRNRPARLEVTVRPPPDPKAPA